MINPTMVDSFAAFLNCMPVDRASDFKHQSFVSTAPSGPGISGAFNFQSTAKSPALRGQKYGKIPAKSPALPGADNNEEQQMT